MTPYFVAGVARMECNGIRGALGYARHSPDSASLHPGYSCRSGISRPTNWVPRALTVETFFGFV